MDFFLLLLGIAGLLIGTELTINGALAVARKHNLSELFVGLIVLSIGSDLPEIAVAIDAGMKGLMGQDASGVVVGASVGSVVAQIGFVLGIAGLMSYLMLPLRYIYRHGTLLLVATAILFVVAFDGVVSRAEALMLILVYLVYVVVLLSREKMPQNLQDTATGAAWLPWVRLVIGLLIVIASSELTVTSAVTLAERLQVSQAVISVLIIGVGTSLPELSISLAAIAKKKVHLSVGNIIGSNIFDTLVPISAAALLSPVLVSRDIVLFDLPYVFFLTSVVLFLFVRKKGLQKSEAALVLFLYFAYAAVKLSQL